MKRLWRPMAGAGLVAGLLLLAPLAASVLTAGTYAATPTAPPRGAGPPPVAAAAPEAQPSDRIYIASGFEGLHFGVNGANSNYWSPPDVQLAVGPNHVVELVNVLGSIWTKKGVQLKTLDLASLLGASSPGSITDPKILYDAPSGRWFASVMDDSAGLVRVAVSGSDDPSAGWTSHALVAAGLCPDQPVLGVSDDKVVVTANTYSTCDTGPWVGVQYWVLNKSDLLAGSDPRQAAFGPYAILAGVYPVQSLSATSTQYMVSVGRDQSSLLRLFTVTGAPPGQVAVRETDLGVPTTKQPPDALQPGTNYTVNTDDARVLDALWDDGKLWLAFNNACTASTEGVEHSCLRLMQVDTTSEEVLQDFTHGSAGTYYFYPALRPDGHGNLVVVFGASSASLYPSLLVTAQAPGDPANGLRAPQSLKVGWGPETSSCRTPSTCRYGDYFGAAIDPSNPALVWVAGEYGTGSGWGTYLASVELALSMSLRYSVEGGGSGYAPPALTYTLAGQRRTAPLNTASTTFLMDFNAPWNVTNPLPGSSPAERWETYLGSGTVPLPQEVVYHHQYHLTVRADPPSGGSVSSPEGWPNASATVELSAQPNPRWSFVGWTGSGAGSYTGPNASASISVGGTIVEIARFSQTPFYLETPFLAGVLTAFVALVGVVAYAIRRRRSPPAPPPPPEVPPPGHPQLVSPQVGAVAAPEPPPPPDDVGPPA